MMLREILPYHHYSDASHGPRTPVELLEEDVVRILRDSPIPDERRDSSICFELKHSSAVTQFARLLSRKRGLPVELCAAGALLHDIHVIVNGTYANHARLGAPVARQMMENVGGFSNTELDDAERLVAHHSDKHEFTSDPFIEFGKDIDVLDAFLYPGAFDWYLANKPLATFQHYLARASSVWSELDVPLDPGFGLLLDYGNAWLDSATEVKLADSSGKLRDVLPSEAPPFLIDREGDSHEAWYCAESWSQFANASGDQSAEAAVRRVVAQLFSGSQSIGVDGVVMIWPAIGRFEWVSTSPGTRDRLAELAPALNDSMSSRTPNQTDARA